MPVNSLKLFHKPFIKLCGSTRESAVQQGFLFSVQYVKIKECKSANTNCLVSNKCSNDFCHRKLSKLITFVILSQDFYWWCKFDFRQVSIRNHSECLEIWLGLTHFMYRRFKWNIDRWTLKLSEGKKVKAPNKTYTLMNIAKINLTDFFHHFMLEENYRRKP